MKDKEIKNNEKQQAQDRTNKKQHVCQLPKINLVNLHQSSPRQLAVGSWQLAVGGYQLCELAVCKTG